MVLATSKCNQFVLFLIVILSLIVSDIEAQKHRFVPGIIDDDEAYDALDVTPSIVAKGEDLPIAVDLTPFCPTPKDQGDIGSCVGWAVGYGALTMLYAIQKKIQGRQVNEVAFSAMYIYNNIKFNDCYGGAKIEKAGDFLREYGNCLHRDFDLSNTNCEREASKILVEEAKKYKIFELHKMFSPDSRAKERLFKVKEILADSIPVIIKLKIRQNFLNPSRYWYADQGDTTLLGDHALVIVAYDENRRAFKVMNSWGTSWGEGGFTWIRYDDFTTYCDRAYAIIFPEIKDEDTPQSYGQALRGSLTLRTPYFPDPNSDDYEFIANPVSYSSAHSYELHKKDWLLEDQYQLLVHQMQKNTYVYAFSWDDKGLNIHFPRHEKYSDGRVGSNEAAIRRKGRDVIIPTPTTALEKRAYGTDYIIILFSSRKIKDFQKRLDSFESSNSRFKDRFVKSFGDILIAEDAIKYVDNKCSFQTQTNEETYVAPIILKVEGQ